MTPSRSVFFATALLASASLASGCRAAAPPATPGATVAPTVPVTVVPRREAPTAVSIASLLSHGPELLVTLHPAVLARDPVYGPLLRRASELAAAYAGPTNLGTTTLAVLERTDEVVAAENGAGKEALIVLRGVPAEVDPLDVVDTDGKPIWVATQGDLRTTSRELHPRGVLDAALFVLPGRVWVIACGPAAAALRSAVVAGLPDGSLRGDDTALLSLTLPGDAIPQLSRGGLAKIGAELYRIQLELTPGATGVILGKLTYASPAAAAAAEVTILSITLAFRHRLEQKASAAKGTTPPTTGEPRGSGPNLDWLAAANVTREGKELTVRAPIPKRWLDALARADVPAP